MIAIRCIILRGVSLLILHRISLGQGGFFDCPILLCLRTKIDLLFVSSATFIHVLLYLIYILMLLIHCVLTLTLQSVRTLRISFGSIAQRFSTSFNFCFIKFIR
jgi:hypothetical protein